MRVALKRTPGFVARDSSIAVRMRRVVVAPAPVVVAAAPAPLAPVAPGRLPAGADMFAAATIIDISSGLFLDVISEPTYAKDFTTEPNEPNFYDWDSNEDFGGFHLNRSAWWKFHVPNDKRIWVDLDCKLSFGSPSSVMSAAADTVINIYTSDVDDPVAFGFVSGLAGCYDVGSGGIPPLGFGDSNPDYWNFGLYGEIHNVLCDDGGRSEGQWYWIQIGDQNEGDFGHAFVLRMSLTEHATADGDYPKWILGANDPGA